MKISLTFLFIFSFFSNKCINCQVNNSLDVLRNSKLYYQSLKIFSTQAVGKTKSSIKEDTIKWIENFFIDKPSHRIVFHTEKNGMYINESKEYFIFLDNFEYSNVKPSKKRFNIYHQRYKKFPFVEPNVYFTASTLTNFSFQQTDSSYLLTDLFKIFEFRKSDFSISKIITKIKDKKNKLEFYEELEFMPCIENDILVSTKMEFVQQIISSVDNEVKEIDKNIGKPEIFDLTLFKKNNLRIINSEQVNFENKIIFLDFFYQGCMPCVKSFPKVNELFKNRDSNFIVIGVDNVLKDTSTMDPFIKRFDIQYPVIIGQVALEISQKLKISVWPTFVVIDSKGKLLEYREGDSKIFFRKVQKAYLPSNKFSTN